MNTITSEATPPTELEALETLAELRRQEIIRLVEQHDKLLECIPETWLDPLLTGKKRALIGEGGTWGCQDIERLLSGIKQRFEKVLDTSKEDDNESTKPKG